MKVYLDNAATTAMDREVLKAMMPFFVKIYANPMSVHQFGQESLTAIDQARKQIANFLNCQSSEIIFTSGATESNNFALKGIIEAGSIKKPHLIISAIEHHCVLESALYLQKKNLAEVTIIKPNAEGIIQAKNIEKSIKNNTVLVSVMYVNNEIGTIQPIAEIGKMIKKKKQKIYFHCDAVQAVNYLSCDVKKLNVDLLSISGHKIYGPKGVSALYIKKGTKISKILHGGEQEFSFRAGTHNVPAIVGLGKAIEIAQLNQLTKNKKIFELRNYFWQQIKKKIPNITLNGSAKKRIPNNLNVSFKNIEGEGILISLDLVGIAVSTGSACSSGFLDPSHVIMAISNDNHLRSHSSVRFTLSKYTTKAEINYTIVKLLAITKKLRNISPFKN